MKNKIIIAISLLVLLQCFYGCGKNEKIGNYNYASYDDFISSASEYSTVNNIYIKGKLISTGVYEIDSVPYMVAIVQEANNKNWICRIGQAGQYSDKTLEEYIGKKVYCFGDYITKFEDSPVLKLNLSGNYCMWLISGNENTFDTESLVSDETYLIKWCDANCEDVIYDVAVDSKSAGTYKSTGLVTNVYGSDSAFMFDIVQEKDGLYYYSNIYAYGTDSTNISDFDKNNFTDGMGLTLYYVIDENGRVILLGYSSAMVDFDLEDVKKATEDEIISHKEFKWGENGKVVLGLTENKQDGTLNIFCYETANNIDDATIAFLYFMQQFENLKMSYSISVDVVDSLASVSVSSIEDNDNLTIYGKEEDGTFVYESPSWLINDTAYDDEYVSEICAELQEFISEFAAELQ